MAKKKQAGTSKLQMVRDAVGELGGDATAAELQNAVKQRHGTELPIKIVGSYKSLVLKQMRKAGSTPGPKVEPKPGKKKKKKMGRPKKTAVAAASMASHTGGISMDEIRAVKALAEKLGAKKLMELAEILE